MQFPVYTRIQRQCASFSGGFYSIEFGKEASMCSSCVYVIAFIAKCDKKVTLFVELLILNLLCSFSSLCAFKFVFTSSNYCLNFQISLKDKVRKMNNEHDLD